MPGLSANIPWQHRCLIYEVSRELLSLPHILGSPLSSHPRDPSVHPPCTIPMSHLDIGIQSRVDSAGSQPDGYGGGVGEGGCHHMAGCWKGEDLEAEFLIEVNELR